MKSSQQFILSMNNLNTLKRPAFTVMLLVQSLVMISGSCKPKQVEAAAKPEVRANVPAPANPANTPASAPKETDEASEIPPVIKEITPERGPASTDTTNYSMLVAFYSPGDGIDFKSATEFNRFLDDYKS